MQTRLLVSRQSEITVTRARIFTQQTEPQRVHIYYHYGIIGPKRPSPLWFLGPNSIIVVYMDPLGTIKILPCRLNQVRTMGIRFGQCCAAVK